MKSQDSLIHIKPCIVPKPVSLMNQIRLAIYTRLYGLRYTYTVDFVTLAIWK